METDGDLADWRTDGLTGWRTDGLKKTDETDMTDWQKKATKNSRNIHRKNNMEPNKSVSQPKAWLYRLIIQPKKFSGCNTYRNTGKTKILKIQLLRHPRNRV